MHLKTPYKVLLNELISVNNKDSFVGSIEKWKAHTNEYLKIQDSLPHRAFSIFLFNEKNQLFLQRRSIQKKTFPLCWTNTCCSHPNMIEQSDGTKSQQPIRESLHRALDRQLKMNIRNQTFNFMGKILYKHHGYNNEQFGQYEVDYVYFCKAKSSNLKYQLVEEEVKEVQWVSKLQLETFIDNKTAEGCLFSPWFIKIKGNGLLDQWWSSLEAGNLKEIQGQQGNKVMELK